MNSLTHFDAAGEAHMVDVGDKPVTHRVAVAAGCIRMSPLTLDLAPLSPQRIVEQRPLLERNVI